MREKRRGGRRSRRSPVGQAYLMRERGEIMPRGDGTGPMGMGPGTGKELGYCSGFEAPGAAAAPPRRAFGRGRRFGSRLRGRFAPWEYPAEGPSDRKEWLEDRAENLREQLKAVEARLKRITEDDE